MGKRGAKKGRAEFIIIIVVLALTLSVVTLQVLFDVPVLAICLPFLRPKSVEITATYEDGVQKVAGEVLTLAYPPLVVQRGVPVVLTLNADPKNIDFCNEYLSIPDFGVIDYQIVPGENVFRFLPEESGVFYYNCRTGNMKTSITVVESLGFPVPDMGISMQAGDTQGQHGMNNAGSDDIAGASSTGMHDGTGANDEQGMRGASSSDPPMYEKQEQDNSMGGWLEQQIMPSNGADGIHEILTWTGWIFDRDCVGIDPVKHTKGCNMMGGCYDSGLGIFEYVPGKASDAYTAIETFLVFDGASKELARAYLRALPGDWKNNMTVKVTGYAVNNIPASADELLVPETDSSRVDHYLSGIHITSIEAAYIDGVSTYLLQGDGIAYTQP